MRASEKTYSQVARNCSAFAPDARETARNSSSEGNSVSCTVCKHFDQQKYCKLDLYDEIVKNHSIEE